MSHPTPPLSIKSQQFGESVIREMSRVATRYKAVNLAQGFPDFACPDELKDAAKTAIDNNINQYAITWGDRHFRDAIATRMKTTLGLTVDPETELTVTCGSTEAMIATLMATVNPGDEVIIFTPLYENYEPGTILCGAVPRYVPMIEPNWDLDLDALTAAFNDNTKAIIINTPNNPTGKVFKPNELAAIAELCHRWNVLCITDEIYDQIVYDGHQHTAMVTLPGMRERTITINALSKTYSVTGWRVGYILAPPHLTEGIRKVHDFMTVTAPAPLQRAGIAAMNLPATYYTTLAKEYDEKRSLMMAILTELDMPFTPPEGAYYILANISRFGFKTDLDFAYHLAKDIGVAVVPGSSFFPNPTDGYGWVRFCYSKKIETLQAARTRLQGLLTKN